MDSLYLAAEAQAPAVRTGNARQVPSESLLDCKPSNLACHYQDRRDPGDHRIRSCSDLAIYLQQQKQPACKPSPALAAPPSLPRGCSRRTLPVAVAFMPPDLFDID
jgi:hypothetical protein